MISSMRENIADCGYNGCCDALGGLVADIYNHVMPTLAIAFVESDIEEQFDNIEKRLEKLQVEAEKSEVFQLLYPSVVKPLLARVKKTDRIELYESAVIRIVAFIMFVQDECGCSRPEERL